MLNSRFVFQLNNPYIYIGLRRSDAVKVFPRAEKLAKLAGDLQQTILFVVLINCCARRRAAIERERIDLVEAIGSGGLQRCRLD
jgi:hypothetical protein